MGVAKHEWSRPVYTVRVYLEKQVAWLRVSKWMECSVRKMVIVRVMSHMVKQQTHNKPIRGKTQTKLPLSFTY